MSCCNDLRTLCRGHRVVATICGRVAEFIVLLHRSADVVAEVIVLLQQSAAALQSSTCCCNNLLTCCRGQRVVAMICGCCCRGQRVVATICGCCCSDLQTRGKGQGILLQRTRCRGQHKLLRFVGTVVIYEASAVSILFCLMLLQYTVNAVAGFAVAYFCTTAVTTLYSSAAVADKSYHESESCKLSFDNCHSRQNLFGIVTPDNSRGGGGDSREGGEKGTL